jgi:hypothetical protein
MTEFVVTHAEPSRRRLSVASSKTVIPEQLSEQERAELGQEMFPLIQRIFDGPWLQGLADGISKGGLGKTTLQRYFNAEGECVGFSALFLDEFEQDGEPWSVFRGFAGLLPEYRTQQRIGRFYIPTIASYVLKNPGRKVFFFAPIVHISSFRVVARHAPVMYPHPDHPLSPRMQEVMRLLAGRYGCKPVEGEHPLVCRRSAWVREPPAKDARPEGPRDAIDRLFQEINPRVGDGLCIITLAPVSLRLLPGMVMRQVRTQVTRPLKGLWRAWAGPRA